MPQVKIGISTTFQGTGAGDAAVALGKVGATASKAERELLAYANAVAKSQRTQGDAAGAVRTYEAALNQVDRTSRQAIATEGQLAASIAQVQRQAQSASILPRTVESFGTQAIDQFKAGLLGIVGPAALVTGSLTALKAAADLTVEGENINRVSRSFESLAKQAGTSGDAIIRALRSASGGEISDLNIQLAADKGLLLGVANSAEQFADIMVVARDRAAKMGITTTQAFDDITTGIGRESPRILDNLGIIVDADAANQAYARSIGKATDELTKAERIEALRNAVVAQGKSTLDAQTTAINDQTNSYARLGVALENAKNKTASFLSTQTQGTAGAGADVLSGIFSDTTDGAAKAAAGAQVLQRALAGLPPITREQQVAQEGWTKSVFDWIAAREVQIGLMAAQPVNSGGGGSFEFPDVALVRDSTAAQLAYANALSMTGVQARAAQQAAEQKSTADKVAAIDAQTHGLAEEKLAKQAQFAAEALLRAGPAGARSAAILAGSSQQIDVLTAAFYRLAAAKQAAVVTNPLAGITEDRSERQGTAGSNATRVAIAEKAAATEQARLRQTIQTGTATQKTAALQKQYNDAVKQFGKNSKEAIDAQTSLIAAQQAADKAAGRGRISAAESTALQLNDIARTSGDDRLRIERENLERLRDQQEDFDVKSARGREDFERQKRALLARGNRKGAADLTDTFNRDQQRSREDFDRDKRRTLRNNAEALGDQSTKVENRVESVNARTAARGGVATASGTTAGDAAPLPAGTSARTVQAQRVIQVVIDGRVSMDSKQVGQLIYDSVLNKMIDDDISMSLLGITAPGSGQTAVAGA